MDDYTRRLEAQNEELREQLESVAYWKARAEFLQHALSRFLGGACFNIAQDIKKNQKDVWSILSDSEREEQIRDALLNASLNAGSLSNRLTELGFTALASVSATKTIMKGIEENFDEQCPIPREARDSE